MTIDLDDFNSPYLSYLLELRDKAMTYTEEEIISGGYVPVFILDGFYFIPEADLHDYTDNWNRLCGYTPEDVNDTDNLDSIDYTDDFDNGYF